MDRLGVIEVHSGKTSVKHKRPEDYVRALGDYWLKTWNANHTVLTLTNIRTGEVRCATVG